MLCGEPSDGLGFGGLVFSPKKCECITFVGKSVIVEGRFEAFLYGEPIPHTRVLRYLGVWFDERLTWHCHMGCDRLT